MPEAGDAEEGMRAAAGRDRWDVVARLVLQRYGQEVLLARRALADVTRAGPARRARQHARLSETPELAALAADVRTRTASYLRTAARDALAELEDALEPEDRELLILRVDRELAWRDVARITSDGEALDGEALERRAAALRKRFEKLKEKLRTADERTRSP